MGLVSGLSLAIHLAWPIFGLAPGPSWWQVHLLTKMDPSAKDSGMLILSSLLLAPPQFSQVTGAAPHSLLGVSGEGDSWREKTCSKYKKPTARKYPS